MLLPNLYISSVNRKISWPVLAFFAILCSLFVL